jgi:hypothetical protein
MSLSTIQEQRALQLNTSFLAKFMSPVAIIKRRSSCNAPDAELEQENVRHLLMVFFRRKIWTKFGRRCTASQRRKKHCTGPDGINQL